MRLPRRGFTVGALALGCAARIGDAPTRPVQGNLRVLTLNVAHGRGRAATQSRARSPEWFRKNLDAIAAVLRREAADVVALQEAELGSRWAGGFDHVEHLARGAGYPHVVAHAHMDVPGRFRYGTAILSRRAIVAAAGEPFYTQGRWRKGWSRITVAFERGDIDVVGLHLDFASGRTRRAQLDEIVAMLATRTHPYVVMGDFNAGGPRDVLVASLCVRAGLHAVPSAAPTYPGTGRRLDWILASTSLRFAAYATPDDAVSDHLPVVADLQSQLASRTRTSSTFQPPSV